MAEPWKKDQVLYRHEARYAAFPSLYQEGDRLWVSFGWNTTRSHYGKAAGGETGGVLLYSPDAGQTWLEKGKPGFCDVPPEHTTLQLSDGTRVSIAAAMHEVFPGQKRQQLERQGVQVKEWPGGHISASYRVRMTRQLPGQPARSTWVELPPLASIANFGFGVVLPGDVLLKPVYGQDKVDDPASRAWCLRSDDRGEHWQLVTMAYDGVRAFNEADLLALPDGRVLAMIRMEGGRGKTPVREGGLLWQTESSDSGRTWSPAVRTNMWGYPPTLLRLRDGRIVCSYGYRRPPYGIRACLSRDGGRTWDAEHEAVLRHDALPEGPATGTGSTSDLGYPRSVELSDGSIFTAYYITLGDGVTHIAASRWSPDYLGPAGIARGAAALGAGKPDPRLPPQRILGEVGPRKFDYGVMQSFIPTEPQITAIAVRVSRESGRSELVHTHGLYVALRKPEGDQWWTKGFASSSPIAAEEVRIGGWNLFRFATPVPVVPGETYALTVYNRDYLGGPTRLRPELSGDHAWYLNTGIGQQGDYPNGSLDPDQAEDIAFKVYAAPGPLPE